MMMLGTIHIEMTTHATNEFTHRRGINGENDSEVLLARSSPLSV